MCLLCLLAVDFSESGAQEPRCREHFWEFLLFSLVCFISKIRKLLKVFLIVFLKNVIRNDHVVMEDYVTHLFYYSFLVQEVVCRGMHVLYPII